MAPQLDTSLHEVTRRRRQASAASAAFLILLLSFRADAAEDTSPHRINFVSVDKNVTLEVLDWGGHGRPLVFLPGLGDTAHVFDAFAPKFTKNHHVYAITRRGFGASSKPPPTDADYDADRLGDDVLAVIDSLKLNRPVIAGHSIAGSELSSIGTRHPERVSALIYLDATYTHAFYNPAEVWDTWIDSAIVRRTLSELMNFPPPSRARALIHELEVMLPHLQKSLAGELGSYEGLPDLPETQDWRKTQEGMIEGAIMNNERQYSGIDVPALVIAAFPPRCPPKICGSPLVTFNEAKLASQLRSVESGLPSARVVRIPYAEHRIFRSNEADVLREMNAFMDGLDNGKPGRAR